MELGFGAIIVDDGWQTLDDRRGYAYTGDCEWDLDGHLVDVRHDGATSTTLTNRSPGTVTWEAGFPGTTTALCIDGEEQAAHSALDVTGQPISRVTTTVAPGESATVSVGGHRRSATTGSQP